MPEVGGWFIVFIQIIVGLVISVIGYFIKKDLTRIDEVLKKVKSDDEIVTLMNGRFTTRREMELMDESAKHIHESLRSDTAKVRDDLTADIIRNKVDFSTGITKVEVEVVRLRDWKHNFADPTIRGMQAKCEDSITYINELRAEFKQVWSNIRGKNDR